MLFFVTMKWPKLAIFAFFSLINPHIAWKYSHFLGFNRKSGSKMRKNGKFWKKRGVFFAKIWHSIQNISKTAHGNILNHICFRNPDNFPGRRHQVIFAAISGFSKNYHWIMCQAHIGMTEAPTSGHIISKFFLFFVFFYKSALTTRQLLKISKFC